MPLGENESRVREEEGNDTPMGELKSTAKRPKITCHQQRTVGCRFLAFAKAENTQSDSRSSRGEDGGKGGGSSSSSSNRSSSNKSSNTSSNSGSSIVVLAFLPTQKEGGATKNRFQAFLSLFCFLLLVASPSLCAWALLPFFSLRPPGVVSGRIFPFPFSGLYCLTASPSSPPRISMAATVAKPRRPLL
eukprot:GHVT01089723.1.p2 GENE.GHVT01089723.1~~GHVT01089723.1.p2  ORF type:complete len:189 (+),score=36.62 GHVT01089723.1:367-933(+)